MITKWLQAPLASASWGYFVAQSVPEDCPWFGYFFLLFAGGLIITSAVARVSVPQDMYEIWCESRKMRMAFKAAVAEIEEHRRHRFRR